MYDNSILISIFELIILAAFWLWVLVFIVFLTHIIVRRPSRSSSVEVTSTTLPIRFVNFHSIDGFLLYGWTLQSNESDPWIILCHGIKADKAIILEKAELLLKAGFNIFGFDFRSYGKSQGLVTSFGSRERCDLAGALVYLSAKTPCKTLNYGVYGTSMGAAVSLMVAAEDDRIAAIVADSTYSDLSSLFHQHIKSKYLLIPSIMRRLLVGYAEISYKLLIHKWPDEVSVKHALSKMDERSILMIHGMNDRSVPLEDIKKMLNGIVPSADLWAVEKADHLGAYEMDPDRYIRKICLFFKENLKVQKT